MHDEQIVFVAFVPIVISAFVPWRPIYPALLAAVVVGILASNRRAGVSTPLGTLVFHTVTMGVLGVLAAQLKRRLWHELGDTRAQLVASERMSVLGKMTAGLAHELKTPLAAAMNGAESLRGLATELKESIGHPSVTEEDLREIVAEVESSVSVVEAGLSRSAQFIQAVRAQTVNLNETQCDTFRVADVVAGVLTLTSHASKRAGVVVDTTAVSPQATMRGDAGKMGQVVTNLVANAVDACAASGRGRKIAICATTQDGGTLLVVEDDGPGVSKAVGDRVFEPLFTTKAKSGGTGLGLSIARDVIEGAFGGTLRLVPSPSGARFEIFCPANGARAAHASPWVPANAA
jgi:signal transduction histidine kinase